MMDYTTTLKAVTYEEARYEFFLQKLHEAERKLEHWQKRLALAKGYNAVNAHDICSKLGWEVNFYKDALRCLGGAEE